MPNDTDWMREALCQAREAAAQGEVPVGAILVIDGERIAGAGNAPLQSCDPTAHAEIRTLRAAGQKLGNYRMPGATLYVTLEPCMMCVGALRQARINRLVFGAREPRFGAVVSQGQLLDSHPSNWRIDWTDGVLAAECGTILTQFFRERRGR